MAYFHEPNFQSWVEPLPRADGLPAAPAGENRLHYGTHFTNMFLRCHPERITTTRLNEDGGLLRLARLREGATEAPRDSP